MPDKYLAKERVIVLRTIKHSESDLVIHCLNQNGERVNFIAKGALKSKRRFGGGVLQPTHYIQATYKKRPSESESRLHFLQEATLLEDFAGLRSDYDRLELAFYFLKVMLKISQEGAFDNPQLFDLLGNALKSAITTSSLTKLRVLAEMKILNQQGVLPSDFPNIQCLRLSLAEHLELDLSERDLEIMKHRLEVELQRYVGEIRGSSPQL